LTLDRHQSKVWSAIFLRKFDCLFKKISGFLIFESPFCFNGRDKYFEACQKWELSSNYLKNPSKFLWIWIKRTFFIKVYELLWNCSLFSRSISFRVLLLNYSILWIISQRTKKITHNNKVKFHKSEILFSVIRIQFMFINIYSFILSLFLFCTAFT